MKITVPWPVAAIALLVGFAVGYSFGTTHSRPARSTATLVTDKPTHDDDQLRDEQKTPSIPIADLEKLQGKRFLAVLPNLLTRAHNGNVAAMRLIERRLDSCAGYAVRSDEQMATVEDREYERQLDVVRQIRAAKPQHPLPPSLDEQVLLAEHAERLRLAIEQNDLCRGLSAEQIESRMDWVQRLVDAGDRDTILELTSNANRLRGTERLRNAERLVQLAASEADALDRLIATGDLEALEQAMRAHDGMNTNVVAPDAQRAYAYAYALSLAAGDRDVERGQNAVAEMEFLERGAGVIAALKPEQIERARIAGIALFQRCCATAAH